MVGLDMWNWKSRSWANGSSEWGSKGIEEISNNKAAGFDKISIELIEEIGDAAITKLCQRSWEDGERPKN